MRRKIWIPATVSCWALALAVSIPSVVASGERVEPAEPEAPASRTASEPSAAGAEAPDDSKKSEASEAAALSDDETCTPRSPMVNTLEDVFAERVAGLAPARAAASAESGPPVVWSRVD